MAASAETIFPADDEILRQQIVETHEQLNGLEKDLCGLDAELDGLGSQRQTFELLERACGTLEQLEALGAAELFWGSANDTSTAAHVQGARERANQYLSQVAAIARRRDSVAEKIKQGQEVLDILEADLFDLELAEQERQQEWVLERDCEIEERPAVMPWSRTDDDGRLRKSLTVNVLLALILGAIIPLIDLPVPDIDLIPELPDRFARLIERELPPPPPPPPVVEEVPTPEQIVEPDPEPVVAEAEPEIVPEVVEDPAPVVVPETEAAPEREVRSAGILAFSESFAAISENRPAARLGADATINDAGDAAVGRTQRSMVTSQAPGSSGGINLASFSRDVGGAGGAGQQIEGVQVSQVASSIGVSGTGDRPMSGGAAGGRTDEEIQIVFDRYKSALYRLYNRELRNDPSLRGQVVLRLTIEPDGSVSFCEVQTSGLGAPLLEEQIVERVKSFDFGAKEGIAAITIVYPIDFLPAG